VSFYILDVTSRHSQDFELAAESKSIHTMSCPHCASQSLRCYGFTAYAPWKDNKRVTSIIDCGHMQLDPDGTVFTVWGRDSIAHAEGLQIYSDLSSHCNNPSEDEDGFAIKLFCKSCSQVSLLLFANSDQGFLTAITTITITPKKRKRKTIKPRLRFDILQRDNHTCQSCGATPQDGATLEIDHIQPFSKGGTDDPDNLQVLCRECNSGKGAR